MQVHVLILTALKKEYDAVLEEFAGDQHDPNGNVEKWSKSSSREYLMFTVQTESGEVRVALASPTGMGQLKAAIATKNAMSDLIPDMVMLLGIAGCTLEKSEASLGDVVVGAIIHDYEMVKEQEHKEQKRWPRYDCRPVISKIQGIDPKWSKDLIESRPDQRNVGSEIHIGDVLSGNRVMADAARTQRRVADAGNVVKAVEMEAAGVLTALRTEDPEPDFIMLKGFSDYAGPDKADGAKDKDAWQEYASKASAKLAKKAISQIFNYEFFSYKKRPRLEDLFLSEIEGAVKCYMNSLKGLPKFAHEISQAVTHEYVREIETLTSTSTFNDGVFTGSSAYQSVLSKGERYLRRASSLFHLASSIWAVSLDNISTFWSDPHVTASLKAYMDGQMSHVGDATIKRLFVFSRPEDAHAKCRLLDQHAQKMSGTYVTSLENYQRLLSGYLGQSSKITGSGMERDFALLDVVTEHGQKKYLAELSNEKFRIHQIDKLNDPMSGGTEEYLHLFKALDNEMKSVPKGGISDANGIINWDIGLWKDKSKWSTRLKQIFVDRTADAFHLVGLYPETEEEHSKIREVLSKLKYGRLQRHKTQKAYHDEMGIEVVRLTKRIDYEDNTPKDHFTGLKLKYEIGDVPDCYVLFKFDEKASLRRFMEDEAHSKLRHNLLYEMSKLSESLMVLLDEHNVSDLKDFIRHMKENEQFRNDVLEKARVWRVDMVDDEMIEQMFEAEPYIYPYVGEEF